MRNLQGSPTFWSIWYEMRAGDDLPMPATEIARCTGLSKTTVLRYLRAMEREGSARRIGRGGGTLWEPIIATERKG